MQYTIGVDLGGTNIAVGIVLENYEILDQVSIPTRSERPWKEIVQDMASAVRTLVEKNKIPLSECGGIGIGCPGTCDSTNGVVLYSNNIKWEHVPIASELQSLTGLSCYISNDANCAALGEAVAGAAKGCKDVVLLTLGTGVGGGIIIDGHVYEGVDGAGAELGHCTLISGGSRCTCGRAGCIESYASASALVEQGKQAAALHPDSVLNQLDWNAKNIVTSAQNGDPTAQEVFSQYQKYLGEAATNFVNIFRPEVLLIGGGLSGAGDIIIKPLQEYIKKNCFGGDIAYVSKVLTAKLGNDAGIIGAAELCRQKDKSRNQPLKLQPAFKDYLWGGEYLKEKFQKKTEVTPLAESWELSCHPDGESCILNGAFRGKTFSQYLAHNSGVLGTNCPSNELPILIKLIDAKDNLSVQVHPDDAYAQKVEHSFGKTEMWYIIDCVPGACLYYGFKDSVSKDEFAERIQDETLTDILQAVEVHPGDVFFIEAGTLHAIGKGIVLAEIQQNSNITYRVYDYGRKDASGNTRPLHIEKALEVSHLTKPERPIGPEGQTIAQTGYQETLLASCKYFTTHRLQIEDCGTFHVGGESFHSLLCIDDTAALLWGEDALPLRKGDSVFLPAGFGDYQIVGKADIIQTTI